MKPRISGLLFWIALTVLFIGAAIAIENDAAGRGGYEPPGHYLSNLINSFMRD